MGFSNSLIIHQVKTKKTQPWKMFEYPALISIDFDDFIAPFPLQVLFRLRRYIKHSRKCFIRYPNTSNFAVHGIFSLFSMFGYLDETLSLMFHTLLHFFLIKMSWEVHSRRFYDIFRHFCMFLKYLWKPAKDSCFSLVPWRGQHCRNVGALRPSTKNDVGITIFNFTKSSWGRVGELMRNFCHSHSG